VIGFFIYLGIYFSRKEDRCTHCGTQISISHSPNSYTQIQPQTSTTQVSSGEIKGFIPKFCSLCGEKLESGIKFCPNCGSNVTEEG
jgi:predicted amidophosphoribosyltransferase